MVQLAFPKAEHVFAAVKQPEMHLAPTDQSEGLTAQLGMLNPCRTLKLTYGRLLKKIAALKRRMRPHSPGQFAGLSAGTSLTPPTREPGACGTPRQSRASGSSRV